MNAEEPLSEAREKNSMKEESAQTMELFVESVLSTLKENELICC